MNFIGGTSAQIFLSNLTATTRTQAYSSLIYITSLFPIHKRNINTLNFTQRFILRRQLILHGHKCLRQATKATGIAINVHETNMYIYCIKHFVHKLMCHCYLKHGTLLKNIRYQPYPCHL
ncbi:hypothetical protein BDA96_01G243000 [Sorghum bicolor]|uniref:Uncharacterized protein n=2 Tax=Sorghum bicolor TaxID=4558 RepID=A0A921UYP4_SORBI|nr:hypothetical protein BDA96_01G243000 [Sorghum bicolor]KXG38405.1 hypothetical protein SORBI_3001G228600 [Sorghum bicolor]